MTSANIILLKHAKMSSRNDCVSPFSSKSENERVPHLNGMERSDCSEKTSWHVWERWPQNREPQTVDSWCVSCPHQQGRLGSCQLGYHIWVSCISPSEQTQRLLAEDSQTESLRKGMRPQEEGHWPDRRQADTRLLYCLLPQIGLSNLTSATPRWPGQIGSRDQTKICSPPANMVSVIPFKRWVLYTGLNLGTPALVLLKHKP